MLSRLLKSILMLSVIISPTVQAKTWSDLKAKPSEVKATSAISKRGSKYGLEVVFGHTDFGTKTLLLRLPPNKPQKNCDLGSEKGKGKEKTFLVNGKRVKGILSCSQDISTNKVSMALYPRDKKDRLEVINQFKQSNDVKIQIENLAFVVPADGFTKAWGRF